MKISGLGSVRGGVSRSGKARRAGGEGFAVRSATEGESAKPVQGVSGTQGVGSLLSLQEVPDTDDERARGMARGRDLLQELEQIRLGLLLGTIPRFRLERIMRMLDKRRDVFTDPRLEEIVREIEVRAAVEMAKFEKANETR